MKTKAALKLGFAGIVGALAMVAMSAPSKEAPVALQYDAAPITVTATRTEISPTATAVYYEAPAIEIQTRRRAQSPAKALSFYYEASPIHVRGQKPAVATSGTRVAMLSGDFAR